MAERVIGNLRVKLPVEKYRPKGAVLDGKISGKSKPSDAFGLRCTLEQIDGLLWAGGCVESRYGQAC